MIATTLLGKTMLMVMICNGNDCGMQFYPESWVGPESYEECSRFIDSAEFNPRDYMGENDEYIVVRCDGNKPEARSM